MKHTPRRRSPALRLQNTGPERHPTSGPSCICDPIDPRQRGFLDALAAAVAEELLREIDPTEPEAPGA